MVDMYVVSEEKVCNECGGRMELDYIRGELVCHKCGLVESSNLTDGPDFRNFGDGTDRSHNGPVVKKGDPYGNSTVISPGYRDANGGRISARTQSTIRRLSLLQKRSMLNNGAKRSLNAAKTDIDSITSLLNLPQIIVDSTLHDYSLLVKRAGLRGRSVKLTVAALVYGSCRKYEVPRTLDEVCRVAKVNRRDIGRAYRYISKVLRYNLMPSNPCSYLDRFCSKLDLPQNVAKTASSMITVKGDRFVGKSPVSIAAAAVYLAASENCIRRTQSQIANVAGVTEVTIRKICREMAA